ncbi:hypothetical protein KKD19_03185 [Patescibacteria group bacterium]|nr:hypothetical protein [Patescibacteria group bacterium]MCG2692638.1 hypothetical protein [Candidatus Parcubacteria bacterium]
MFLVSRAFYFQEHQSSAWDPVLSYENKGDSGLKAWLAVAKEDTMNLNQLHKIYNTHFLSQCGY